MNFSHFLITFFIFAPLFVNASNSPHSTPETIASIDVINVTNDVYVLHGVNQLPNQRNRGLIANLGFIVSDSGVVVVDSGGSAEHGRLLLEKIATITAAPVIAVFNTHIHGDHWLGNAAIAEQFPQAEFYAHEKMAELAQAGEGKRWIEIFNQLTEGALQETVPFPPTTSISNDDQFSFGDINVTVLTEERAHSVGDIIVFVEKKNAASVVFTGDIAVHNRMGIMDDGSFKGNIAALDKLIALNAGVYVPGHGPTMNGPTLTLAYRNYLAKLYAETQIYYEEGLADFEIKGKILPGFSAWKSWYGFDEAFGRHVNLVFLEVEEEEF